ARALADHPGHAEVSDRVKANLQNLKSVLRKQKAKKAPRRPQAPTPAVVAAAPAAVQKERPRAAAGSLERLEGMIDECLFLARGLGAKGLKKAAALLRQARKEVIRQTEAEGEHAVGPSDDPTNPTSLVRRQAVGRVGLSGSSSGPRGDP